MTILDFARGARHAAGMDPHLTTQEKLLHAARAAFWSWGYSNVSVRQIAKVAEVDVALISRYFGGKLGLFQATLAGAFDFGPVAASPEALIDQFVTLFAQAPRGKGAEVSALRMVLTNAHDEAVGALVRQEFDRVYQSHIIAVIGAPRPAALFVAAVMGISVAEKTLKLQGIDEPTSSGYADQLRHMLRAALDCQDPVQGA